MSLNEALAQKNIAGFMRENIPDHLLGQWSKVCDITHAPMQNAVMEHEII